MHLIAFAVVLAFVSSALGGELRGQYFYSYVDEKHFVAEVSPDQLAKTPVWQPEAENPPLSARHAIKVARKQMESLVADRTVWPLQSVQLLDMGDHLHWIYLMEFEHQFPENVAVVGDFSLRIPVLMDGVAVPAETKGGQALIPQKEPNQSMQLTAGRRTVPFYMTKTRPPEEMLVLASRS